MVDTPQNGAPVVTVTATATPINSAPMQVVQQQSVFKSPTFYALISSLICKLLAMVFQVQLDDQHMADLTSMISLSASFIGDFVVMYRHKSVRTVASNVFEQPKG